MADIDEMVAHDEARARQAQEESTPEVEGFLDSFFNGIEPEVLRLPPHVRLSAYQDAQALVDEVREYNAGLRQ